jgi:uncharacterized pyridoxal phosphate-containing UPF0001 family protein
LIGPLQSNKTKPVAEAFDWVHSVDRLKIAERLAAQRPSGLPPLQLCLQVNISEEASKNGVAPAEVPALAADDLNSDIHASAEYRAHLCGVMLKQAVANLA